MSKYNIFIDIDGVLTPYDRDDYVDDLWLKHPEILFKQPVIKHIPSDWIILSCASSSKELKLKEKWCKHFFPDNECHITYCPKYAMQFPKHTVLIDDYKKNLANPTVEIPIKFLNGINSYQKGLYNLDKDALEEFIFIYELRELLESL